MRPLVLKIRGLRSYREEVEIDFREKNLAAIIGDTGAGKSSILEAICLALYGSSTWSGRVVKDLISASEQSLSVVFTFTAEGATWTATRTARRGSGPGQHLLTCEENTAERYDSASAVNARVEQLLGLDYDGFLRTVVLPQGRFQQLLQATPSERNSVLKGIFRVDELEAVRVYAENARNRLEGALNQQIVNRGRLLDNPTLTAAETAETIATASAEVESYRAAAEIYRAADAERTAGLARVEILRTQVTQIIANRRPADAESFAALAKRAAEIDTSLAAVGTRLQAADALADQLDGRMRQAEAEGLGPDGLSRAAGVLEWAAGELPQLRDERDRLTAEADSLETGESVLESQRNAAARLAETAQQAAAAVTAAEVLARDESALLGEGQAALRDVRRQHEDRATLATEHEQFAARLSTLEAEVLAAEDAFATADAALKAAETALDAARRMDHAAAASQGVGPGDPCPVCTRELPAGFAPVHSHEEATAQAAHAAASTAERQARSTAEQGRARRIAAADEGQRLISRIAACDQLLERSMSRLEAVLPAPDFSLPDTVLLESLAARAELAAARVDELRSEAASRANEATVAATALLSEENRLATARAGLDAAQQRLKIRRRKYEDTLTALPGPLRPANTVVAADIEMATQTCSELLATSREAQEQRDAANAEARALNREAAQLRAERTAAVDAPVQELRLKQATLVQSLVTAAALLEEPYQQPLMGGEFVLESAAGEAIANDQHAEQMLAAAERASLRAQAESQGAEGRMAAALAAAKCASLPELDQARIGAAATLRNAEDLHAEAVRQQPIVAVLDQRIEAARELSESLEAIRTHFSDSKFIGFVMKNRQKILLAVGSEVLASMTSGRYGFAEDFRIVDSWSGQPRDVMTLSGGETFLASLALALGLVELAGRSGGKLDALFLDEGFGSLDANTLPDALRALETQASGGRFVAVISHLRAVAESFDHVLHVRRTPTGSKADWLSGQEREAMLGSDAESGLLS